MGYVVCGHCKGFTEGGKKMIKIKVVKENVKVQAEGDKFNVMTEAGMAIDAAIKILKSCECEREFCHSMCEIALSHQFEE